ncbi:hypothetical protein D3C73_1338470 [compost metagenome]
MDGGGDGHSRQIEQIIIAQYRKLYRQHMTHLVTQGQVGTVRHFLFRRDPDPQLIEDFSEQLFLAGEMVVHRALGHTGGGGNSVHAGDVESIGTEFDNRRLNDGFAFAVGEALWSCHKYASAGRKENYTR